MKVYFIKVDGPDQLHEIHGAWKEEPTWKELATLLKHKYQSRRIDWWLLSLDLFNDIEQGADSVVI